MAEIVDVNGRRMLDWADEIQSSHTLGRYDGYLAKNFENRPEMYDIYRAYYREMSMFDAWGDVLLYKAPGTGGTSANPGTFYRVKDVKGEFDASDGITYRSFQEYLAYNFLLPIYFIEATIDSAIRAIPYGLKMPWNAFDETGDAGAILTASTLSPYRSWDQETFETSGISFDRGAVGSLVYWMNRRSAAGWHGGILTNYLPPKAERNIGSLLNQVYKLKGKATPLETWLMPPLYWLKFTEKKMIGYVFDAWDYFNKKIVDKLPGH